MGVFTRLKDIVNSNLNAMLDSAEDPEKLIRLMVQEMEDTLVDVKASCAGAIAARKKAERSAAAAEAAMGEWEERARLAIDKGRDDLAREALREKKRFEEQAEAFRQEAAGCGEIVDQYKADIAAVEERLLAAREKHRLLVQRHIRARNHKQAQTTLRRAKSTDAVARFDQLESRVERMEAEASLVNYPVKTSLMEQLEALRGGDQIEKELEALKRERRRD